MKTKAKTAKEEIAKARAYIESRGLYVMKRKDIPRFVDVAVDSYDTTYPLNNWFMGGQSTLKDCREMWIFNLKYFCDNALIYADSPECNAWTLWIAPGCKGVDALQFIAYGGLRMTAKLGMKSLMRIMKYEDYSASVRLKATGGKEWYWYNLVCAKQSQGQHLTAKLFQPMAEYAQRQARPIYLETHTERNTQIYQHFGFEITSAEPIPQTDLIHYGMKFSNF